MSIFLVVYYQLHQVDLTSLNSYRTFLTLKISE